MGPIFLKIDVGVGVGIPRGPRQSGLVTVVDLRPECVWGRDAGRNSIDTDGRPWDSHASALVVETFSSQNLSILETQYWNVN